MRAVNVNGSRITVRAISAFSSIVRSTTTVIVPLAAVVVGACLAGPIVFAALLLLPFGLVGAALVRRPAVAAYDAHNDAAARAHRARMAAIRNARSPTPERA